MLGGDAFSSPITEDDFYKILQEKTYDRYFKTIRNHLHKVARATNRNFDRADCDHVVWEVLSHCWHYYLTCLPATKKGRRPSGLKDAVRESATYAKKLRIEAKIIFGSRDHPVVRKVLDAYSLEALPFLCAVEDFYRACEQLEPLIINDRGGKSPASSFAQFVDILAGTLILATGADLTISKRDNFFIFISTVNALLNEAKNRFPSAQFDLPPNDEALRKTLERIVAARTEPH